MTNRLTTKLLQTGLAAAGLTLGSLGTARAAEPPHLDPDKPVECRRDADGLEWRVQCDERTRTCAFAPNAEVDAEGRRVRPLERVAPCAERGPLTQTAGQTLVPAIADAPYGWVRDARGRVMQFNFDLQKRLWLGGGYTLSAGDGASHRGTVEAALLRHEHTSGSTRYRFRLLEGELRMGPVAAEGVLFRFDHSERRDTPLLRVTTFFDKPRRTDVYLNTGVWLEAGRVELFPRSLSSATNWRIGAVHATVDLWQSSDATSYVRLRSGASFERASYTRPGLEDRTAIAPGSAMDADLTLDRDGFHHVTATAALDFPQFYDLKNGFFAGTTRVRGELGYEVILLAVNDQPVTLRLAGMAARRSDIVDLPDRWTFDGSAGLRFSLWAPPRQGDAPKRAARSEE